MGEKYSTQIFRVDGKNSFLEVLNTCMPIGKLLINMCQYDEKTHKEKLRLEFYLDFPVALYLAELIRSGRLDRIINEAEKTGVYEGQKVNEYTSYFTDMGGTKPSSAKHAKYREQFDWLTDKQCVSKIFKIQKSTKYKYIFRGEYGPGRENETGLIVPDGKSRSFLQIPFTEKDSIAFARLIDLHIQAYLGQFYNTYSEKLFSSQQCKVFEAVSQSGQHGSKEGSGKKGITPAALPSAAPDMDKTSKKSGSEKLPSKDAAKTFVGETGKANAGELRTFRLRTRSELKPMPKDRQSMCMEACLEDGTIKYIVFLEGKINSVEPDKWKRFEAGLKNGKMLVDLIAVENSKGTLYFDKFA